MKNMDEKSESLLIGKTAVPEDSDEMLDVPEDDVREDDAREDDAQTDDVEMENKQESEYVCRVFEEMGADNSVDSQEDVENAESAESKSESKTEDTRENNQRQSERENPTSDSERRVARNEEQVQPSSRIEGESSTEKPSGNDAQKDGDSQTSGLSEIKEKILSEGSEISESDISANWPSSDPITLYLSSGIVIFSFFFLVSFRILVFFGSSPLCTSATSSVWCFRSPLFRK